MSAPTVVGVDLSGPGSPEKTAVARFAPAGRGLSLVDARTGATDAELLALVPDAPCAVGLDAPLSYAAGGGSRASDRALRRRAVAAGLHAGTVMAPSAPRMVYLTLRGVALTRRLAGARPLARIVEVHPASALALRGAPADAVREMKRSAAARRTLVAWLGAHGLAGLDALDDPSDHLVAALAAALAAWRWNAGDPAWLHPAEPPEHPYDFAC